MTYSALICFLMFAAPAPGDGTPTPQPMHTISMVADRNSVFRVLGEKKSEMDLIAGEPVRLRVDARKAKTMNRDGSIHGLALLDEKRKLVPGWDLLFKPGIQEIDLVAPTQPGLYEAVCTVICSPDHDGMKLRVVVSPR